MQSSNRIASALRPLWLATLLGVFCTSAWAAQCNVNAVQAIATAGTEITKAEIEKADSTTYCAVEGTMVTSGNKLTFRLGLPSDWNGKFLYEAPGGGAGLLVNVADGVTRHYAVATSDTGHKGFTGGFDFWPNKEQRTDWVHRGVHTATVGSKALVQHYYARPPDRSFLRGCSNGGRAGIMEAQRYPTDYDGIISAAPASDAGIFTLTWIWDAQVVLASTLTADDWKLVGRAVREECDAKDGLKDGLIQDYRRCELPRQKLLCQPGQSSSCLDAGKLAAIEKIWNKPVLSDGRQLPSEGRGYEDEAPALSFYASGSVLDVWRMLIPSSTPTGNNFGTHQAEHSVPPLRIMLPMLIHGPPSALQYTADAYRQGLLLPDRTVDVRTFDVVKDGPELARQIDKIVDVTNTPDLAAYLQRGSKLLLWHGMADVTLSPQVTFDYFEAARADAIRSGYSADKFDRQVRLYTSPTTGHCAGGSGPNEGDLLGVLDSWVTQGQVPEAVKVVRRGDDGKVVRSRLICPMPQEPQYVGKGSIDDSASFICSVPADRVGVTGIAKSTH